MVEDVIKRPHRVPG